MVYFIFPGSQEIKDDLKSAHLFTSRCHLLRSLTGVTGASCDQRNESSESFDRCIEQLSGSTTLCYDVPKGAVH